MLVLAGLAGGAVVGAAYFAALWRSVRDLAGDTRPERRLLLGALARFACVLPAIYLATRAGPEVLAGGIAGLLIARTLTVRWLPRRVPAKASD
ncbi:hypothetical protein DRB17_08445 [Ferruginivarius sediminum]|uniref:ATP synthase subunit I n=2 Tax=Ferruginivarius sediminum TaxID=2661937 RepID=A0A369TBM5_9PROT|nr:hypothetical protein DRB17_08445 [Ferruginivarius sediminum]